LSQFLLPGARPFTSYDSSVTAQAQASSAPAVLAAERLAHGAYYAGKLGTAPAVARWHGKKRVFVLAEITLGRPRVKTVFHVADGGTGERFAPLSQTAPNDTCEVTDFAFETCA
jgi:hypothetical protein